MNTWSGGEWIRTWHDLPVNADVWLEPRVGKGDRIGDYMHRWFGKRCCDRWSITQYIWKALEEAVPALRTRDDWRLTCCSLANGLAKHDTG